MIDENSIQIINNMKSFDKQSLVSQVYNLDTVDENELVKKTIDKFKSRNNDMEIEFESTKKYFDVNTNKAYLDISVIERDKVSGVEAVLTETFEI